MPRRIPRGYEPSDEARAIVRAARGADTVAIARDGTVYLLSIVLMTAILAWEINAGMDGLVVAPTAIIVGAISARQLRGLELIVHDASHRNFIARHIRIGATLSAMLLGRPVSPRPEAPQTASMNDVLSDVFFASPVLQRTSSYRHSHRRHHGHFGGAGDPCRYRMESFASAHPTLKHPIFVAAAKYVQYVGQYYQSVASDRVALVSFAAWHVIAGLLTGLVAQALLGIPLSVWAFAWFMAWIIPLFVVLPGLRLVAEVEEHDYANGATEFEATVSNTGLLHRLFFHPWNDTYHLLHHLFPSVPQSRHRRLHRKLLAIDEGYANGWNRRTVLGPYREQRLSYDLEQGAST